MSKRIKVTGYIYIEDDEYDPGPLGPLTAEAYEEYVDTLGLDDVSLSLVEED